MIADHDDKDIKKGISALYKRVDKHFDAEDESQRQLMLSVWRTTQAEYMRIIERLETIVRNHYQPGVTLDWSKANMNNTFAKRDQ